MTEPESELIKAATMDAVGQLARGRIRARMDYDHPKSRDRAATKFEEDWRRTWPGLAALIDRDKEN